MRSKPWIVAVSIVSACSPQPDENGSLSGGGTDEGDASSDAATGSGLTSAATVADADTSSAGDEDPKFDVGDGAEGGDEGGPGDACHVADDLDAPPPCDVHAPADSFTPEVQWSWWGPDTYVESAVIPLVANLTDDDGNGSVDLCDVPDVVVMASVGVYGADARMFALDGATGAEHFEFAEHVTHGIHPALGDIDGDGEVEIVTVRRNAQNAWHLVVFENDGTLAFESPTALLDFQTSTMALADMDADGDVEILAGIQILDHTGNLVFTPPDDFYGLIGYSPNSSGGPVAADLDDDGDLELVLGRSAFHHDGTVYYDHPELTRGNPQVADVDDDGLPEVVITATTGLALLEHDGTVTYHDAVPFPEIPTVNNYWARPAAIHDFDADGTAEFAMCSRDYYTVYEANAAVVWSALVDDSSGATTGTAFDFLGDGSAEAIYSDQYNLMIYDDSGTPLLTVPRSSWTDIEYPIVADVDNDGSAEILMVSAKGPNGAAQSAPTLQVIRDAEDRWVPARRIWNQHTYHVTNVREDGTIPQHEPQHWKQLNTFRTQAQTEQGVCQPDPAG